MAERPQVVRPSMPAFTRRRGRISDTPMGVYQCRLSPRSLRLRFSPPLPFRQRGAQEAPQADAAPDTDAIIVTGTRVTGMRAADSAAPIQVVGTQAIANVGQQDLTQVLAQSLPSLNFQAFGGDTANLTLSAALRGLSPNNTLVLVNGKRRHGTANLAVLGGSPYSGSAAADFSFVPVNSIGQIEVLQDGAAAQYGSDAIAGVINVILKKNSSGGMFTLTGGQFYKGDGETFSTALNAGFKLGERGFVNLTGEYKYHNYTQRGTFDRRYFTEAGAVRTDIDPIDAAGVRLNKFFPRVNNINGDAQFAVWNFSANAEYELSDALTGYAFGSYGNRVSKAYQNYRRATRVVGTNQHGRDRLSAARRFQSRRRTCARKTSRSRLASIRAISRAGCGIFPPLMAAMPSRSIRSTR